MKKKYLSFIAAIALVIGTPLGYRMLPDDDVSINLKMSESYSVGDLITLDASASEADALIWKILPQTPNFMVMGKIAIFCSSEPIEYTLIISAINDGYLDSKIYILKPKKEAEKVKTLSNFEIKLRSWVPPNAKNAKQLAQSFEIVAVLIDQDTFESIESLMLATVRVNHDALGVDLVNWVPFFAELENHLKSNPPQTLKNHAQIWKQIAEALKKC